MKNETVRNKVALLLYTLFNKCKKKETFSLSELIGEIKLGKSISGVILKEWIVKSERGGGKGRPTAYTWLTGAPNDELIDFVLSKYMEYNKIVSDRQRERVAALQQQNTPAVQTEPAQPEPTKQLPLEAESITPVVVETPSEMERKINEIHMMLTVLFKDLKPSYFLPL